MKKTLTCHFLKSTPTESDIVPATDQFDEIKTLVDESHLIRRILKCKKCGQIFFYEFYEEIDWIEGKDPQYRTFIPVDTIEEAQELNKKSEMELLGVFPRLQSDFVGDTKTIKWVR